MSLFRSALPLVLHPHLHLHHTSLIPLSLPTRLPLRALSTTPTRHAVKVSIRPIHQPNNHSGQSAQSDPDNQHPPRRRQSKPSFDPLLPPGFTFYPNHNDYPSQPVPDPSKMYTSSIPPPHLPRSSIFHYLFPPKRKGKKHFRYYPVPEATDLAFVDGITGRELYRNEIPVRSMWLHSGMKRLGLKRGDVITIFGTNSLEWVEACYGIQAMNAVVSPANYGYTPDELLHQLVDSGAKAIFVQPSLVPTLEKALSLAPSHYSIDPKHIILLCQYADKPENTPYACLSEIWEKQAIPTQIGFLEEKDTAYLCYSSGTTGKAKGVETSHHNMTSQIQAVNLAIEPMTRQDRILGILPFGHIYGLTMLVHQPLTTGVPVVILPRFDDELVLKTIERFRVSWGLVVPPMLIALLNSPHWDKYDLSSLRGVQTGAAPCSKDLIAAFEAKFPTIKTTPGYGQAPTYTPSCRVTQGYGLTETSPVSHIMTLNEGASHVGSIGRVMPTMQARLVDPDTGKDMDVGEKGELWLRGTSVMKGYWRNEEATKNAFAPGGWFKTGDVAVVDEEGYFKIVDRVKELIKYKGYQVPPAELESLLLTHPKVADAGVIGIYSDSQATELPRAYIVPKATALGDAEDAKAIAELEQEVIDWVAGKVSNHKRLRGGAKVIKAVPKSPSGKILRKDLRAMAKEENLEHVTGKKEAKL